MHEQEHTCNLQSVADTPKPRLQLGLRGQVWLCTGLVGVTTMGIVRFTGVDRLHWSAHHYDVACGWVFCVMSLEQFNAERNSPSKSGAYAV